ncbi:heme biosynthesis HemY N-terminal domain-containing protein [Stenotrophomonas sp.]|jgi:HemY protein|uniref:heme biosynthesis protein HemY n=1 Tax=Stenotrophomonas sp. TaxID=69392 RepID=UPI0003752776|nr:heme biosynthesis HemY N-terminal domain-containing protein [Stenotrophomonas sp.]MBD3826987.1 heme biosynthesis protein HemY [Stenotrophomonas sp.]QIO86465.1 porphyrin biosynthesis protein [Stenotrophomonas rhizophila]
MKPFQSLVVLLLAVALGVIAAQWLGADSLRQFGEVIYRYAGNDYRSTVPQVALAALVALLLLWLLWSLVAAPFRAWGRYRRKQGRARLTEGLQAHEYGHWQRAEKLLGAAAEDKEVSAVALATAVRSAQARGDEAAANQYLQRLAGEDATSHALLLAERLLGQERPVDAINALDVAAIQPLPPRGLWLRTEALARAERAHEAYGQLGALRKQKVLPDDAVAELEARLAAQSLLEAGDVNALAAQWEATPKALRSDPDVVAGYALRAVALDWDEPALLTLEQALDTRWDESLVTLYGQMPVDKLATRQANLQRWLTSHPASPALLLALGRIAVRQRQHAAAEDYLHRAIAAGAGPAAWEALGEVFHERGDAPLAAQCFANALRQQRGEDSVALARATEAAAAVTERATVEEQSLMAQPLPADPIDPVGGLRDERDDYGNPRLP